MTYSLHKADRMEATDLTGPRRVDDHLLQVGDKVGLQFNVFITVAILSAIRCKGHDVLLVAPSLAVRYGAVRAKQVRCNDDKAVNIN